VTDDSDGPTNSDNNDDDGGGISTSDEEAKSDGDKPSNNANTGPNDVTNDSDGLTNNANNDDDGVGITTPEEEAESDGDKPSNNANNNDDDGGGVSPGCETWSKYESGGGVYYETNVLAVVKFTYEVAISGDTNVTTAIRGGMENNLALLVGRSLINCGSVDEAVVGWT
jgi:hypothetical protein